MDIFSSAIMYSLYHLFFQLSQTGPENATEKEWGVNYRALNDLFHISHNRGDTIMYEISVQMIEIYNEQIRDLLGSSGPEKKYPFSDLHTCYYLLFVNFLFHCDKYTGDWTLGLAMN